MPLPVIVPILLFAGGAAGLGLGAAGASDLSRARRVAEEAHADHAYAMALLEIDRAAFERRATAYGERQVEAAERTVVRFVKLLERLEQRARVGAAEQLEGLAITPAELRAYRGIAAHLGTLAARGVDAVGTGIAASSATVGLVGLFASASTGAPIAGLTGAAAQSATLAWLGGGSLAAGGGGMAAGTVVLGGIALAPMLLVGGFALASQGEKALSEARAIRARAREAIAEADTLRGLLARGGVRIDELSGVLDALVVRAGAALDAIDRPGFRLADPEEAGHFQRAGILVRAVADLLRTAIFDDAGELSVASAEVLVRTRRVLG